MVQRMEKAGLIGRRHDKKDQRITRIFLTDQGYEMKKNVAEQIELNERYVFMGFSDAGEMPVPTFYGTDYYKHFVYPGGKNRRIYRKRRG